MEIVDSPEGPSEAMVNRNNKRVPILLRGKGALVVFIRKGIKNETQVSHFDSSNRQVHH